VYIYGSSIALKYENPVVASLWCGLGIPYIGHLKTPFSYPGCPNQYTRDPLPRPLNHQGMWACTRGRECSNCAHYSMLGVLFGFLPIGLQCCPLPTPHLVPQLSLAPRIVLTSTRYYKVLRRARESDPTCISDLPFPTFALLLFSLEYPFSDPHQLLPTYSNHPMATSPTYLTLLNVTESVRQAPVAPAQSSLNIDWKG
jgi:hypothetical protein